MARPRSNVEARIRNAALVRFLNDGVDGASLRAIARDAKTNIGMIYYYFPKKDDLFFAIVDATYLPLLDDFGKALEPSAPLEARVTSFYRRLGNVSEAEFRVLRLVLREVLASTVRLERMIEYFKRGHVQLVFRAVMDGLATGKLDPAHHPFVLASSLMGLGLLPQLARRVAAERFGMSGAPDGAALSDQLARIYFAGVGRPSTASASPECPSPRKPQRLPKPKKASPSPLPGKRPRSSPKRAR